MRLPRMTTGRWMVAVAIVWLLVLSVVAWHATTWPRLSPGTEVTLVDDDGGGLKLVITNLADTYEFHRFAPGTCGLVVDDSGGTFFALWNRMRRVYFQLDGVGTVRVERINVAPVR